ncbi:MAG: hypothetical protein KatS3mg105_3899 [Gemmatales bacterium]|nr:MAG: hypothetical protein KatS3mg105_3899 [Gemmatales bacterium]
MIEHHRRHPPKKVERPKKLVRTMVAEMTGETFSWEETFDPSLPARLEAMGCIGGNQGAGRIVPGSVECQ